MSCHRHRWAVVEKTEQPSGVELAQKAGMTSARHLPGDFFVVYVIVHYRCEKCGTERVERI